MYSSVLVANRGEIALRIISTLQDHGIKAIVTSSDLDLKSIPSRRADAVLHLPGKTAQETYLDIDSIVRKSVEMDVDAIHPGYGFLAENANFAKAVNDASIDFIGPTPDQMTKFGDKIQARKIAEETNTPITAGSSDNISFDEMVEVAKEIGFPLLIKASAGGGGRGIRLVNSLKYFKDEYSIAKSEAKLAFDDDRVYLEKFIPLGRHIEVQVLGDGDGKVLHFGERDCSMQRKNQKLIEESPASSISRKRAKEIHQVAVKLVSELNYKNAGTVEFLVDEKNYYFLEVNARIQVEHPVTEFVTGEDLIWLQIQIAAGSDIGINQKDIKMRGHAIEARIYAENPYSNFSPSTGKIHRIKHPIGSGVRVDSAIEDGDIVSPYYDPMISKLIVHSPNRNAAINKMIATLDNYLISGVHTTVPYIKQLLMENEFTDNDYHTRYLDGYKAKVPSEINNLARIAAAFATNGKKNYSNSKKNVSKWKLSARGNW